MRWPLTKPHWVQVYVKVQNLSYSAEAIPKAYHVICNTRCGDSPCKYNIDVFPTKILYVNIGFASRWIWSLCLSSASQIKAFCFQQSWTGSGGAGVNAILSSLLGSPY